MNSRSVHANTLFYRLEVGELYTRIRIPECKLYRCVMDYCPGLKTAAYTCYLERIGLESEVFLFLGEEQIRFISRPEPRSTTHQFDEVNKTDYLVKFLKFISNKEIIYMGPFEEIKLKKVS